MTDAEGNDLTQIGVTGNHPVWSEDRQDFVRVDSLAIGEQLRDTQVRTLKVGSIEPRAGPEQVFNLEVDVEHVYYVSAAGVLVHNSGDDLYTSVDSQASSQRRHQLKDPKTGRFIPDPNNPRSSHKFTDAQRRAAWKALAQDPDSPLTDAQRIEIEERGWRGPQRLNEFDELETMELSHEPIPLRDGGTNVVPRWPADHAAIDPHRFLKKRDELQ